VTLKSKGKKKHAKGINADVIKPAPKSARANPPSEEKAKAKAERLAAIGLAAPAPAKPTGRISRRGLTRYAENPFIEATSLTTKTRSRTVKSNETGDRLMVVSETSGEILAPAGFWHTQEVDKTQFVKLFVNGVKAIANLSAAGTKAFALLYVQLQKNIGKDQIVLSFYDVDQEQESISKSTFFRGVSELVTKGFLAESMVDSRYFVNPDYIWNGDRLAFVKEYRLKEKQQARDTKTLDLFDEQKPPAPRQLIDDLITNHPRDLTHDVR
jgi:hypothetical protein